MVKPKGSKPLKLNKEDLIKILKGAIIAGLGVALTYLSASITDSDFGNYTALVTAAWSVVVNAVNRWISDNSG